MSFATKQNRKLITAHLVLLYWPVIELLWCSYVRKAPPYRMLKQVQLIPETI